MTRRRSPVRARFAAIGYRAFYHLPPPVRRRLVRVATAKYIVGSVVLVKDSEAADPGRLLLLRQPGNRGWSLPAGLLRRREPPVIGAARELAEETGIDLEPERLTPAVPNALVHAQGWVDMVFEARVPASKVQLSVDGAEVYEAAWHPLDDLPVLSRATDRLLGHYGITDPQPPEEPVVGAQPPAAPVAAAAAQPPATPATPTADTGRGQGRDG